MGITGLGSNCVRYQIDGGFVQLLSYRPYVVDNENYLCLRFSALHVQSEMRKAAPYELILGYTQAMMAFLLLKPEPLDILIVGLGGGSLSKYCYHTLPQAKVTTVEISAEVIGLREDFCIPADDDRFHVIHADAAKYLQGKHEIADIILLDGYDERGIPEDLSSLTFYRNCHAALKKDGVLVSNFNCSGVGLSSCLSRLNSIFNEKVITIKATLGFNEVSFSLKDSPQLPLRELQERAARLRAKTGLPFRNFMTQLLSSSESKTKQRSWLLAPHESSKEGLKTSRETTLKNGLCLTRNDQITL